MGDGVATVSHINHVEGSNDMDDFYRNTTAADDLVDDDGPEVVDLDAATDDDDDLPWWSSKRSGNRRDDFASDSDYLDGLWSRHGFGWNNATTKGTINDYRTPDRCNAAGPVR